MNTFVVLFFCVQACLVQNVFSQCQCANLGYGLGIGAPTAAFGLPAFGPASYAPAPGYATFTTAAFAPTASGIYGGAGEGNVAVAGELPVAGTTLVAGQVPILGAVQFGGDIAAGGAVSITGNCACGCGCGY